MLRLRTRKDAAKFLTEELGYPTSPHTLNKLFCIGGGPPCRHVGRRPFYGEHDLVEWVENRLTQPRASSSEPRVLASSSSPDIAQSSPSLPIAKPPAKRKAAKPREAGGRSDIAQAQPDAA
jgi:hypothetical protein